ncbi:adenosylcobinamide-GDP ribazoletransferase [Paenibacillus soyae]|uniref:Adenosylcobinamide-GDP ribazoletransferase n=1 Tax=Paenibacillus soyae TaxID=2969249 RepID=A0A9X2MP10_9BACL|nr:adenosylcobinamide-GDP ribazoletransferase [Paenibacillus soyae]MCR2805528.1 adenosylcobinamide-GDP ribazoletransferase [Paenibacillus soyae]
MDRLKLHAQAVIAALQFLTRLPVPVQVPFEKPVLSRSVIYFPLAGALIGCALWLASELLDWALPPWPAAIILVSLWVLLTGGLHLDGWMDTADGVLSHRPRDRMLEIMKDSRVGAMGVIAAVLLLLLKTSVIAELFVISSQHEVSAGMLYALSAIWSRMWMAAAIGGWPKARGEEGLAALFNDVNKESVFASVTLSVLLSFLALNINGINRISVIGLASGPLGAALLVAGAGAVTVICGGAMALWLTRKLGGLTGDTYGAMNEAIEATLLLAALIWIHQQI